MRDLGHTDDESLLAACRAGEEAAFVTLVRRHHAALAALARCWPGAADEAERDVAAAWLAVVAGGGSEVGSVRARVGRATVAHAARRTGVAVAAEPGVVAVDPERFFADDHDFWPREWADPPRPWGRLAARRLARADIPRVLARATRELGPARAAAVTLRDVHGWPLGECATALGLCAAQLRALLQAGRERLRGVLEAEVDAS